MYWALDEEFERRQRVSCVDFFQIPALGWNLTVLSLEAVVLNQALQPMCCPGAGSTPGWWGSLPPPSSAHPLHPLACRDVTWRLGIYDLLMHGPLQADHSAFPVAMERMFYRLMQLLHLTYEKSWVLVLIFPARKLKNLKGRNSFRKTRRSLGGSPLWPLTFWGLWVCDLRGKWTHSHLPAYCHSAPEFITNLVFWWL